MQIVYLDIIHCVIILIILLSFEQTRMGSTFFSLTSQK
jgi:hypothetical protein